MIFTVKYHARPINITKRNLLCPIDLLFLRRLDLTLIVCNVKGTGGVQPINLNNLAIFERICRRQISWQAYPLQVCSLHDRLPSCYISTKTIVSIRSNNQIEIHILFHVIIQGVNAITLRMVDWLTSNINLLNIQTSSKTGHNSQTHGDHLDLTETLFCLVSCLMDSGKV